MSKLRDLWDEYHKLLNRGRERDSKMLDLEKEIHEEQRRLGVKPYDFDKLHERRKEQSTPTINTPPTEPSETEKEVKKHQPKYSLEEAKRELGENTCAKYDWCGQKVKATYTYSAHVAETIFPECKTNPAFRGQLINMICNRFNIAEENNEFDSREEKQ